MSDKEVILTPEGLHSLERELEYLRTTKRREIASRIKQAIEFGDISDNSEYEDAKNEQAFVEGRIMTLENILRHAVITQNGDVKSDVVTVGSTLTVKELESGKIHTYTIVGSQEADPGKQRISNESPVGKALLGRKGGTIVTVTAPAGTFRYEILSIDK